MISPNDTEVFFASLPLKKLLDPSKFEVTPQDISYLYKFQSKLDTLSTKYVMGKPIDLNYKMPTIEETSKIADDLLHLNIESALVPTFIKLQSEHPEGAGAFLGKYKMILGVLQNLTPKQPPNMEKLPYNTSDLIRLRWALCILDTPLLIYELMSKQLLTDVEVNIFKQFYPMMYQFVVDDIIKKFIELKEPITRPKMLMLSILLQTPVVTPQVMNAYMNGKTLEDNQKSQANLNNTAEMAQKG